MNAIAKAFAELKLPTKPEILDDTPIHMDDVGMVYVLTLAKNSGKIVQLSLLHTMNISEVGGWYEITKDDVNRESLATADD